jgi:type IV pilus assembly protein PilP
MRFRNSNVIMAFVMAAPILLSGCSTGDLGDLKDFVAAEKSKPAGHVKPLPQPKEYESFEYDSSDLRDPFVPIEQPEERVARSSNNGIGPKLDRRKEALEVYPLDSLRMVGTLKQDDTVWGLIKTADGTVHRVRTGNFMGQNYGKITSISDVNIDLVEFIRDGLDGWVDRKATLALSE